MATRKKAKKQRGECACKAVQFEVEGPLRNVVWCHCSKCQRWHGGPGPYTSSERGALTFSSKTGLTWWEVAPGIQRGFCRVCGSSLFWAEEGKPNWSIAAGALISPTGLKSSLHIFVGSKPDWYDLGEDGVKRKDTI